MEINKTTDNILIVRKCLKSYLTAKKYYDLDLNKSYEYLKQCTKILDKLKEKKLLINDNFMNIIDETETECNKYLTAAIKTTIEKPIKKKESINDSELFEIIETGNIEKIKNYKYGQINFNIINNQGMSLLHHAIIFGDIAFLKNFFKLGACIDQTNRSGHTLLEFACLEKDPNIINFLTEHGADMKKHLRFRAGKKFFNGGNEIDILLIEKIIMENENKYNDIKYLNFIFEYIDRSEKLELGYSEINNSTKLINMIPFSDFILNLDNIIDTFDEDKRNTFITIIKEELHYDILYKLGCPTKKLHILLYNLIPFIEYNDNLKLRWLISLEIKYIILKILKNKAKINTKELKKELSDILYNTYINQETVGEIVPKGLLQLLTLQWIYKIKV